MASETEQNVERYLEGVDYPAAKEDLVSTARDNDAPEVFMKRLVDLPIVEYSDPQQVAEAMDGLRPPEREEAR